MKDVDAVPRAMDVLRDPSEDHGRLGGGAAVDGNEEHARVPPPFGPRRGDWRRGRRRGVGRLARALPPPSRVAMAAAREGRCASGILDARRVWSRAGHVVPVEYLYQYHYRYRRRPVRYPSVWNRTSLERERKREKRERDGVRTRDDEGRRFEGAVGRSRLGRGPSLRVRGGTVSSL